MGKYLVKHGVAFDKVLCSTAERTSQTWDHVSQSFKTVPPLEYSEKLYLASGNELLNLIAATDESVKHLLIIGHNPGLHELCLMLAKDGDNGLRAKLSAKFPTCGLATLVFDGAWGDIGRAPVTLAGFVTPKMLP